VALNGHRALASQSVGQESWNRGNESAVRTYGAERCDTACCLPACYIAFWRRRLTVTPRISYQLDGGGVGSSQLSAKINCRPATIG